MNGCFYTGPIAGAEPIRYAAGFGEKAAVQSQES